LERGRGTFVRLECRRSVGKAIGKLIWKWGMGSESLLIDTKQP
jgi:hypothetical protein